MRTVALLAAVAVALGLLTGPTLVDARGGRQPPPYVQPGCTVMFLPGQECLLQQPGPGAVAGCCVSGHRCEGGGGSSGAVGTCQPLPASELTYGFAAARGAVAAAPDAYAAGQALELVAAGGGASQQPQQPQPQLTAGVSSTTLGSGSCARLAASPTVAAAWCAERRLLPGDSCDPSASPAVECCPDGYACSSAGDDDNSSFSCRVAITASAASAAVEPLAPAAEGAPQLLSSIVNTAVAAARCAAPSLSSSGARAAAFDVTATADTLPAPSASATLASTLPFPPPAAPADACSCRVDPSGNRVPAPCPSPWDFQGAADGRLLPPALRVNSASGLLETAPASTSSPPGLARLRGVNWFGWETGQKDFDGLWAFCDDIGTANCPEGQQIPPWFASGAGPAALSDADRDRLKAYFWGRRTATNDFASVVHAIKALGFNAVRVPFTFAELAAPIAATGDGRAPPQHALCLRDDLEELNFARLADPTVLDISALRAAVASNPSAFPRYTGAPHPPPPLFYPADQTRRAQCDLPWEAGPMQGGYRDPSRGDATLRLTTCNWYLPQAPGMPSIHRFLWQVEYLVSQGLYVLLSYHPTAPRDAVAADAALFANNWGNLWRSLASLPSYGSKLRGRVFADLLNEGSRYGCMYERAATVASGQGQGAAACAPMAAAFTAAAAALKAADPSLPGVLINGLGQSGAPADVSPGGNGNCVATATCFPGMPWGDGFVTRRPAFAAQAARASNASALLTFTGRATPAPGPQTSAALGSILAFAPHAYPSSVTGWPIDTQQRGALHARFNASWGLKVAGRDALWSGRRIPKRPPALLGEIGTYDDGDNGYSAPNADTTRLRPQDVAWLRDVRQYFSDSPFLRVPAVRASRRLVGRAASSYPFSWFWWSWNANSLDTKGLVGPTSTWRVVQWSKVRAMVAELGLRPWWCAYPAVAVGVCPPATVVW